MGGTRTLDLLLVNPGGGEEIGQKSHIAARIPAKEPPVWAGLMAAYARQKGFSVEILDANVEDLGPEQVAERVADIKPLLTVLVIYGHQPAASTQTMTPAGEIATAIRRVAPDLKLMMVGGHVAALPERTLREEAVDFTCSGEGPVTIVELLSALGSGRPEALRTVRGLLYHHEDGGIVVNPPAPIVTNLDVEMPGIAWDLLSVKRYRAHDWHCLAYPDERSPYAATYTTLGCPYHCSFCQIQSPFKSGERLAGFPGGAVNSYRHWSPNRVVDEIEMLVERYGIRNLKIADEMFVLNPRHVLGICGLLIERGLGKRLNMWAYSRVDSCRPEFLEKLSAAGFRWLAFGIEAADAGIRRKADKGEFGEETIFEVIRRVREAGISVVANFVFGLPGDDWASMQRTLDLAMELNTEWANFFCAQALPGSALYEEALAKGWRLPDRWVGFGQHSQETLPLATEHLSGEEVLAFVDFARKIYYANPAYHAMLAPTFGPGAVRVVKTRAAAEVVRKHVPDWA